MFPQPKRAEARLTFRDRVRDRPAYESLSDLVLAVRAKDGQTTTDLRQQGERRYQVRITYGCALTRVSVRAEDGRSGAAAGSQLACCREGG